MVLVVLGLLVAAALVVLADRCWDPPEPEPAGECDKPGQACGGSPGGQGGVAKGSAAGGAVGGSGGLVPDSSTARTSLSR